MKEGPRKLILSAPLTHSDWMLKAGVEWGAAGVRHMLDACKECGWTRIYWRVLDGGRAMYRSKEVQPAEHWDKASFWSPQSETDKALFRRVAADVTETQRVSLLGKLTGT